ncbi:MAG: site-2 protease family protein [Candidatus Taylorbacteria bacterium]
MTIIFTIIILVVSVMLHELSHGYTANYLGDPTARLAGRLTINPLKHIDLWGSIIVPIITSLFGFTFGWAKPVPYNPYNLKNKRSGELLIALAGPAANIAIALIFGIMIRLLMSYYGIISGSFPGSFVMISSYIVAINIILAIFNLIPIPPLDGSKILFSLLPQQYSRTRQLFESYSFILILIVAFFLWQFIMPIIPWLFKLITGVGM